MTERTDESDAYTDKAQGEGVRPRGNEGCHSAAAVAWLNPLYCFKQSGDPKMLQTLLL